MILPDHSIGGSDDWASIIVADCHKEYPLQGCARIIFDPHEVGNVMGALNVNDERLDAIQSEIFEDLSSRYNGYYDIGHTLWLVRGHHHEIARVFDDLAMQLMGGPRGADDDAFDYWPNAWDMLCVMAKDLIALNYHPDYTFRTVVRVVDSAIALQGPPSEWEADFLDTDLNALKELLNERQEA